MIIKMMYVLPMLLGRTFHAGKNTVGLDIFKPEDIENPRIKPEDFYKSSFKIVESSSDVKETLQIEGDLALKIKAGMFNFRGFGSYVKSSIHAENSVDVLTKVSYRTISKTLDEVRPVAGWNLLGKEYLGTHYVKTVLYGGDLIACIKFKAMNSEDLQDIRASIKTSLEGTSAFDLVGSGQLESLDQKLKKKATMEISYFATVPLENVPNDIEGLRDLVNGFEDHVKKVNNGTGVPVEVILHELSNFDQGFEFSKNAELETELEFFEEYFDDLMRTKALIRQWIEDVTEPFTKEQQKKISDFTERVSKALQSFLTTIENLDYDKGSFQLQEALSVYSESEELEMPSKYRKEFLDYIEEIVPSSDYSNKFSSVYYQVGSSNCTGDKSTILLYTGYVASSPRNQIGGGTNFLCMPQDPDIDTPGVDSVAVPMTLIAGVKYGLMETTPKKHDEGKSVFRGVICAACLVQRQTLFTFQGTQECPERGGWKTQYAGYLMASTDTDRAENVCVDLKREANQRNYIGHHDQSLNFALVMSHEKFGFVPCVVCSK